MKQQRLAFIDTETTGLDVERHEIIEIGCVLVEQDWDTEDGVPSFRVFDEFDIKIKPEQLGTADPVSLRVNGYTNEEWVDAISKEEAMKLFSEKTVGAIMVGHNVSFDSAFLDKVLKSTGYGNQMHYLKLDTISIAFAKLNLNETIEKYSLRSLCEYFGIANEHSHRALSDARATFELYKKLIVL